MKYSNTIFPPQKIPAKKKNEAWAKACVDYIAGMSETVPAGQDVTSYEEMQTFYDLYNSIFDEKDLKYVTDPFKQDDGFPASPRNFNIIRPKIDLLIGEESKSPFKFTVLRTSDSAVSDIQEEMKSMLYQYVMGSILADMNEEDAIKFQEGLASGEIMPPEKLSSFLTNDYKDIAETSAVHAISYLKEKLNIPHEFNKGFKDLLIAGKEVYYVGIRNGEPHLEVVNPMYLYHDSSPDVEYIEDGDYAARRMRMSATEIYDRLYDKMDEKDLDALMDMTGADMRSGKYGKDSSSMDYHHMSMKTIHTASDITSDYFDLWHTTWKSYKKIGFLTYLDEMGMPQETIVTEDYINIGNEIDIKWDWIIEVWEGYRIGDSLYVGMQPIEYQHMNKENLNSQKLPYVGTVYSNSNSSSKSLVALMKPLQYMYIIVWYRLELALSRDKGKIITMDITQIPKSMGIDAAKWMHYLSAVGVNFVNPYEEGWDIPGREGGKASAFNQISEVDLTMANVIDQYVNLMAKIEDMIGEISGVTRQRQGAVSSRELVGSVDRSITQSSLTTEPLFWAHNQVKRNVLRMLLNTSKEAWRQSGRHHLQYIYDDASRAFTTLSDNFFYEDHDIFVSDSNKELANIEMVKSLYQPAMQNGATLLDIAEIMTKDNISRIKSTLKDIETKRMEQMQAQQEAENNANMQAIEAENEIRRQEMSLKEQELMLQKYKIDVDSQTRITVAELGAYRFQEDLDADNNNIPDPMEIADMALRGSEMQASIMDKRMQASNKAMESENKMKAERSKLAMQREAETHKVDMENKKVQLERDRMKHEKELQSMKDKAAIEREKLKAKTALKNKTSGEK